jgi:hypothetical protein
MSIEIFGDRIYHVVTQVYETEIRASCDLAEILDLIFLEIQQREARPGLKCFFSVISILGNSGLQTFQARDLVVT